mmetsp:Transcript_14348/g.22396  ORF Transcript_14348/g.22396 Transcript_14348/m.22396 type:complete len:156 (+) Transcript_14348:139-606(+)|eukprot:CAMPEP_0195306084 /NCGR_PEP_ID=MMETSP0707-20130614/37020_1 /TAXON_ID=33640 /ORGANISM="Asterionellopsis glacialis, Strain CCMP134" /LENGTH=155 /DNA_ID=CAMNT_0040370293 /DNA_START=105 /DNA_END=572 /DNA_ORIENTATION=+
MTGLIPFASDAAAVGMGAVCGALCRHQVGRLAAERVAADPKGFGRFAGWHTAGINIGGSFILGGIAAAPVASPPTAAKGQLNQLNTTLSGLSPRMKLLLGVGFCGSFTTFSTYSVDVVTWLSKGETTKALSYVMVNNVGGAVAACAGMMLMKRFF